MALVNEALQCGLSRRGLLKGFGTGAVMLAVGCSGPRPMTTAPTAPTDNPDFDLLNFALNLEYLEYLEAEFYLRAATGTGLAAADIGAAPRAVTGGSKVMFANPAIQEYALEFANDEMLHVQFLRQTLGTAAVDRPAIDLTNSFNALAAAAGIGASFNPFADENSFLTGAFIFEDVGVTAYHGAARSLKSNAYLVAATGIMGTEAYHAGEIRTLITGIGGVFVTYANQISTLRGMLGGGNETPVNPGAIVAEDNNCAAYARTTDEVLHIVYGMGAGAVTKGGFFPNGMNGTITATAS